MLLKGVSTVVLLSLYLLAANTTTPTTSTRTFLGVTPESNTILIAILATMSSIISPLTLAWLGNKNALKLKEADYQRQDEVADRLAKRQDEVAAQLAQRQDESEKRAAEVADQAAIAAKLLVESNKKQEEIAIIQGAKLDQIHTLVNSNLTAAMQDQLDAHIATLALLHKIIELTKNIGPQDDILAQINTNQIRVTELKTQLEDRKKQTASASQQLATDLERKPA